MFLFNRFMLLSKKMNNKRKTMFLKLMISYMAILLIPIVIGILLFDKIESIMVNNANQSNTAMLEQVRLAVDNRLHEIEKLSQQISYNPKLQKLLNNTQSSNYEYIDFIRDIARYQIQSTLIHDYYLYFSETDTIVSPTMKTNVDLFYSYTQAYNSDQDEMKTRMSEYHFNHYFPSEKVVTQDKETNIITFIQSLPFTERQDIKGALVIRIDEQQIREMLQQIEWVNKGYFYILNEQNEIIMSNNEKANKYAKENQIFETGKKVSAGIENENIISYTTSEGNEWTYVSIVPKEIVLAQVNYVKNWAIELILILITIGVLASYFLANRNYRPIREVVDAILKGMDPSKGKYSNELEFIKQSIVSSMDEQEKLHQIVSKQAPVIKADFISRMIRGHVDTSSITREDLEFMGVTLTREYFTVLMINIDDCSRFIRKNNTETEWALSRFVISNLSEELLQEDGYIVELARDQLVILMNQDTNLEEKGGWQSSFVNELKENVERHFHMEITVAISKTHQGIDTISECYREAVLALDYRMVKGPNSIIYYREIKDNRGNEYYYPVDMELQLLNYAKSGDSTNVEEILKKVFKVNIQSKTTTPEMGKLLAFDLISSWFKLLSSVNEKDRKKFMDEENPFTLISNDYTFNDVQEKITRMYHEFCHHVNENQTAHSEQLYQRMIDYIDEHYHDNMFSLNVMADHLGMNPSYLSTFFKKQGGQNITEYITQIRVNESKRMLVDHSLTIAEIAQKVGYANSVGLIRVFKKIEGISPGKYRTML